MLPSDVIDYIFSFLQSDCATLRECSKSHPFLAFLAERHLYVYIALQNHPTRNDPKLLPSELLEVFAERPEILNNIVQGLSIELIPLQMAEMKRSLEDIASILSIAGPRLRSITLTARSPVAWRNLDEAFQKAFLNCIRSPSVTEASLQDVVGFQLSELVGCRGLKRLSLQGRFRQTTGTFTVLFQPHPILELESLSLCNFRPLRNIVYWEPLRNLRALDFHSSKVGDFYALKTLLGHCSGSLTCLRVDLADSFQTRYDLGFNASSISPLPSSLIHLEHVTVHAVSSTSPRFYFSAIPDIAQFLQAVPLLRHLTLRLHFDVEESFVLHEKDALCIRSIPAPHIKLHISASNLHGTIPPSEILPSLEHDAILMEMVTCGSLYFTAEGHFCGHFSCCSQDISAYVSS